MSVSPWYKAECERRAAEGAVGAQREEALEEELAREVQEAARQRALTAWAYTRPLLTT
jgi:hypothetical protein